MLTITLVDNVINDDEERIRVHFLQLCGEDNMWVVPKTTIVITGNLFFRDPITYRDTD